MNQKTENAKDEHVTVLPEHMFTPMPKFDARGTALLTLAVLATLFALKFAAGFIVPVVIAILLAYTLDPIVSAMARYRVPRWLGALVTLTAVVFACGFWVYTLRGQAQAIVDQAPVIARKLSRVLDTSQTTEGNLEKMRKAAEALQKATEKATGAATPGVVTSVVVEQPANRVRDVVITGGIGLAAAAAELSVVIFLVFFLLAAGDKFKRKFVKIAGHTLSEKKITVQMFDQMNRTIQRYMLMLLVTNGTVGVASWIAFRLIGLENAGTWGLVAGVLHLIPYFGPLVTALATGAAAFMQFDTLGMALLTAAASLGIAAAIGMVLTTWMIGRMAKMNTVAVFLSLLLFGAIWGVWGVLLSGPIAVILKVISDHVEGLSVVSEFLSE